MQITTEFLEIGPDHRLAFQHRPAAANTPANIPANIPGFVFLAGHGSDMLGTKAEILADWAARSGFSFTRFDYRGHGQSSGAFLAHTISDWTADARHIIEQVTSGPLILVGSSLGGWIMLNLLNSCRQRIAGLIGIAAAPDFTERLIWQTLNKEQQEQMQQQGHIALPNPYEPGGQLVYPYHLIEDGRANLLLDKPLEFDGPVILHQGMQDEEVPWQTALDIAAVLTSDRLEIRLDKTAGHRYSEPHQLAALVASAEQLSQQLSS